MSDVTITTGEETPADSAADVAAVVQATEASVHAEAAEEAAQEATEAAETAAETTVAAAQAVLQTQVVSTEMLLAAIEAIPERVAAVMAPVVEEPLPEETAGEVDVPSAPAQSEDSDSDTRSDAREKPARKRNPLVAFLLGPRK